MHPWWAMRRRGYQVSLDLTTRATSTISHKFAKER